mmetsp:Transcript_23634/g.58439  ORF Transcript_23634/g.58439 Transcript_23634/m.58439 type:complete len:259 (+) Transcript_23634:385-1161(+)
MRILLLLPVLKVLLLIMLLLMMVHPIAAAMTMMIRPMSPCVRLTSRATLSMLRGPSRRTTTTSLAQTRPRTRHRMTRRSQAPTTTTAKHRCPPTPLPPPSPSPRAKAAVWRQQAHRLMSTTQNSPLRRSRSSTTWAGNDSSGSRRRLQPHACQHQARRLLSWPAPRPHLCPTPSHDLDQGRRTARSTSTAAAGGRMAGRMTRREHRWREGRDRDLDRGASSRWPSGVASGADRRGRPGPMERWRCSSGGEIYGSREAA